MQNTDSRTSSAAWRVFRAPLLLAVLIVLGLAAALFGTGIWRWFSWATIGLPAVLCLWYPTKAAWGRAE